MFGKAFRHPCWQKTQASNLNPLALLTFTYQTRSSVTLYLPFMLHWVRVQKNILQL